MNPLFAVILALLMAPLWALTRQLAEATSWHEVAGPPVPDNVHIVQHGDTLASIVERLGHPGEWRTLFHHNVPEASRDKISPDSLPVGAWLRIPDEWLPEAQAGAGSETEPVQPPSLSSDLESGTKSTTLESTAPAAAPFDDGGRHRMQSTGGPTQPPPAWPTGP